MEISAKRRLADIIVRMSEINHLLDYHPMPPDPKHELEAEYDRLSDEMDAIIEERPVPSSLVDRLKDNIKDIMNVYRAGMEAGNDVR